MNLEDAAPANNESISWILLSALLSMEEWGSNLKKKSINNNNPEFEGNPGN